MLTLLYGPTLTSVHDYWRNHSFDYMDFVGKVISLLFNTLSRFVIGFFPRSKCLLISWGLSLSAEQRTKPKDLGPRWLQSWAPSTPGISPALRPLTSEIYKLPFCFNRCGFFWGGWGPCYRGWAYILIHKVFTKDLWWLILHVNLTGPWAVQIFG